MFPEDNQPAIYTDYDDGSAAPQSQGGNNRIKIILAAGLLAFMVFILLLLGGGSNPVFVEVSVESDSDSEITYQFLRQEDGELTEIKDTAKQIQQRLPEGNYELTVLQDNTSYLALVESGEETVAISAKPEPEKGRRFIGNQPGNCWNMAENILYSYECGSVLGRLKMHLPATNELPTYTQPVQDGSESVVQGAVQTRSGHNVVLLREAEIAGHEDFAEEEHAPHTAQLLNRRQGVLTIGGTSPLSDLEGDTMYRISEYRDGFITYDREITQAYYYRTPSSDPQELAINDLSEEGLKPYALNSRGNSYIIAYANETDNTKNTIIAYMQGSEPKRLDINRDFTYTTLCGQDKICSRTGELLEVFSPGSETPSEPIYSFNDAQAIAAFGNGNQLLVVRAGDAVVLDVEERKGAIQYSFGEAYEFCGLMPIGNSYSLCVENDRNARSIISINQRQESDEIDKQAARLLALQEVNTVSVYDTFIFISPEAGRLKYIEELKGFDYDPETLKSANQKIHQEIEAAGIDTEKYKITNTLE